MPSAFILGAGPRIGLALAKAFKDIGYDVAVGSRSASKSKELSEFTAVDVDLKDPSAVQGAFDRIAKSIGPPHVVVYNAAALTIPKQGPFSISNEEFVNDLSINVVGAYASLHAAAAGWEQLKEGGDGSSQKTFIATGNVVPFQPMAVGTTLGSGKAALAHLVQTGNIGYEKDGYRFYFASQVTEQGGPVAFEKVDADAHARVYKELAQGPKKDWDVRFVA